MQHLERLGQRDLRNRVARREDGVIAIDDASLVLTLDETVVVGPFYGSVIVMHDWLCCASVKTKRT